jgi:glycosyltransferase involved in cell wall biosynthesis
MERILITSTQYPYYGGAATNAYALIKYFRRLGVKVCGAFFEDKNVNVDPDRLGGVFAVPNKMRASCGKKITQYLGGEPDIILCKNYVAPVLSKEIFPNSKIVYLASGCPHMMELSSKNISAIKYLKSPSSIEFPAEKSAIKSSDFVIPNSEIGRKLLEKHYGKSKKILDPFNTSFEINKKPRSIEFSRRNYDIGFICSNFNRTVKNSRLALTIFNNFKADKKIAIGNNSSSFKLIKKTIVLGPKDNDFIIKTLSQTKLIICPSYYDASPNIIREAILCGCNILVSKNCGWSEVYPEPSVCQDIYDKKEWIDKVAFLTKRNVEYNYKHDIDFFKYLKESIK